MSAGLYAIQASGLCRSFGKIVAVDQLDLRVKGGEFYGLLGPNGAGKSTTVSLLCGMLAPTAGSVSLLGKTLGIDDPDAKRQIGVVFEEPSLFELLSGWEQLTFAGQMYGLSPDEVATRAGDLLRLLELEAHGDRVVAEYSKGMRRKLAVACALIHAPQVVVLDEPFEGVDASSAETVETLLRQMVEQGATVLLTTHVLDVAQRVCDRVGILQHGRLACEVETTTLGEQGLAKLFREVVGDQRAALVAPSWLLGKTT